MLSDASFINSVQVSSDCVDAHDDNTVVLDVCVQALAQLLVWLKGWSLRYIDSVVKANFFIQGINIWVRN